MAFADGNIVIGTSVDVGGLNTGLAKIQRVFGRFGRVASMALGVTALTRFGKAAIDAASDLQEVQNIVDVSFEEMVYKIEDFAKTSITQFGMTELAAKQTAGSFMAMGKSMGLTLEEASSMSVRLTGLTGDFASFYNISQEYAKVALSAVYTGETETLKRYGIILTEANLQEYASTLGIQKKVKAMSAREKAIIRYKYILQATADMEGDFVRTEGNWANQVRVLQQRWNQFLITVGNGLITVLTPLLSMLNTLIDVTISFSRVLGAALANIFHISFQSVVEESNKLKDANEGAIKSEDELAKSLGKSAKAAKRSLAPFDELNVLKKDSTSGSGAGPEINFDDADLAINKFGALSEAIQGVNSDIYTLYQLGNFLGTKLKTMLDGIDWESVYDKARNFGSGLAEFINGFIDSGTFAGVGTTIAGALNTAIYTALAFGTTLDWSGVGKSIADGINNFLTGIDAGEFANAVDTFVQGIFDLIISAVGNIDWSLVFQKAKQFFSSLDPETYAILTGLVLLKALTRMALGKALLEGIAEAFGFNFGAPMIAPYVKSFGFTLGTKILALKNVIATSLKDALTFGISSAFNAAKGLFTQQLPALFSSASGGGVGIFAGIASVIGGLIIAVKNFFDMWQNGWSGLKTVLEAIGIALATVGAIILGAPAAIAAAIAAAVFAISQVAIWVKEHWEAVKQVLAEVAIWTYDHIVAPIVNFFEGLFTRVGQMIEGFIIIAKALWVSLTWFITEFVINPIVEKFKAFIDFITPAIQAFIVIVTTVAESIFNVVKGIIDSILNVIRPAIVVAVALFNSAKETIANIFKALAVVTQWVFDGLWAGIVTGLKAMVNTFFGLIESGVNGIVKIINTFLKGFNFVVSGAASIIGADWSGVDLIPEVSLPRLAKGAVIPPNHEFAAILGDQKSGTNIEAPLDTIKQAVSEEISEYISAMMAGFEAVVTAINEKDTSVNIGDSAIGQATARYNRRQDLRRG